MVRQYLRITSLVGSELNVARMDEDVLNRYADQECSRDAEEVFDWIRDVSVGDDISIYRDNGKACVIVRVQ